MNACVPHALLFRMVKLYYMFFFTSVYALFFCLSSLNKAFIKPQVCEEHSNYSGGPSSKKKNSSIYGNYTFLGKPNISSKNNR